MNAGKTLAQFGFVIVSSSPIAGWPGFSVRYAAGRGIVAPLLTPV